MSENAPIIPAPYAMGMWAMFVPTKVEGWQQGFSVEKSEKMPHITKVRMYGKESQMYNGEFAYLLALMLAQVPDDEDPVPLTLKHLGLPCDITIGEHVFKQGSPLQTLVTQAKYWFGMMNASTAKAYQYDVEHPNDGLNAPKDG